MDSSASIGYSSWSPSSMGKKMMCVAALWHSPTTMYWSPLAAFGVEVCVTSHVISATVDTFSLSVQTEAVHEERVRLVLPLLAVVVADEAEHHRGQRGQLRGVERDVLLVL